MLGNHPCIEMAGEFLRQAANVKAFQKAGTAFNFLGKGNATELAYNGTAELFAGGGKAFWRKPRKGRLLWNFNPENPRIYGPVSRFLEHTASGRVIWLVRNPLSRLLSLIRTDTIHSARKFDFLKKLAARLSSIYLRRLRCCVLDSAIDAHCLSSWHDEPHRT